MILVSFEKGHPLTSEHMFYNKHLDKEGKERILVRSKNTKYFLYKILLPFNCKNAF